MLMASAMARYVPGSSVYGSIKMATPVAPFANDCAQMSNISSERSLPPAKAVAPIVVRVGIICQPGPSAAFSRAT